MDATHKNLRVLSGITPSSSKGLHLGNYLGAVKPQVEYQDKGDCFYFIADSHALNSIFDPKVYARNVYETYLDYLALGIDTKKTTFFVESFVKEIYELTEILNNVVTYGEMKRMHAFKDKLADPNAQVESINMGLFNYPILMAADILVFEADLIPVGEDQAQHVEICRDIAQSFNIRYGNILTVPSLSIEKGVGRVPGTDGIRKMGKSLGNDITIFAPNDTIKKQIMGITTDPNRIHKNDPGDPAKNVIFTYFELMDYDQIKLDAFKEEYRNGEISDVFLKLEFFDFFMGYFKNFREMRNTLQGNKDEVITMIRENGLHARNVASQTMEKVRKSIGQTF